ncbi:SRPBCC family protein [Ekhidna sp.]|uniref:SRPBCC family protein n=1 Tax=Ekhidna sp. TaxID=2608089 RepID=UPI003C7E4DB6
MRIKIATEVQAELDQVKSRFNEDLFLSLNPPFPPVKLVQFGGCKTGDVVELELNFILFKQKWISKIVEDYESKYQWYFIDMGTKLPFFLKSWKHVHDVRKVTEGTMIVDDITFSTGTLLTDMLMFPLLYFQFLYRKPVYKKWFKE